MTEKPKQRTSPHDGIHGALIAAQKAMGTGVPKDGTNPAFRSKYATLESVLDTITGAMHDNGMAAYQTLDTLANGEIVLITTLVFAETGETIESRAPVRCKDRDDPQKIGGAITYMRRYSLLALLGLAPEDDDGNVAAQPVRARQEAPQQPARQTPEPTPIEAAPRQAARTNALPTGVGNGRTMNWTDFWDWAKPLGFRLREDIETVIPEAKGVSDTAALKEMIEAFLTEAQATS